MKIILAKLRLYWSLTKSLQTGLLLSTGLAGFMSARCPVMHWYDFLGLAVSLFLAIAGSTIINMWYDRDIDAVMCRTHHRPLADGKVASGEALRLGTGTLPAGRGDGCRHVPTIRGDRLCRPVLRRRRLHVMAQAAHLLEHRLGWDIGRDAHPGRARLWHRPH